MLFTNETYDKLKWIAQYLLPGLGTFWFAISAIWGFPYGEQILGTITALDTFLGVLLGISQSAYQGDGTMYINTSDPEKDIYRMELAKPIETLGEQNSITFKVEKQ